MILTTPQLTRVHVIHLTFSNLIFLPKRWFFCVCPKGKWFSFSVKYAIQYNFSKIRSFHRRHFVIGDNTQKIGSNANFQSTFTQVSMMFNKHENLIFYPCKTLWIRILFRGEGVSRQFTARFYWCSPNCRTQYRYTQTHTHTHYNR